MSPTVLEVAVAADHKLKIDLPCDIPAGTRIRVTLEPLGIGTLHPIDLDLPARTPLWGRLEELRAQAAEEGVLPNPLSWDEVIAEAAERRGEEDG